MFPATKIGEEPFREATLHTQHHASNRVICQKDLDPSRGRLGRAQPFRISPSSQFLAKMLFNKIAINKPEATFWHGNFHHNKFVASATRLAMLAKPAGATAGISSQAKNAGSAKQDWQLRWQGLTNATEPDHRADRQLASLRVVMLCRSD